MASILSIILVPCPAGALWSVQGTHSSIDLGGSIRAIGCGIRNYDDPLLFGRDNDYDGSSQALLRLTSTGSLPHQASFEVHVVGEAYATSIDRAGPASYSSTASSSLPKRYRLTRNAWDIAKDDDFRTSLDADRLNITCSWSRMDITLGRQAINFSQAYFWNPLDVFLAFDPEAFDRDYKPGVDALRADVALGSFSYLTIVAAAGREMESEYEQGQTDIAAGPLNAYGSALMARFGTTVKDWDIAVQAGKVYGGYQAGVGFSGELSEMGVRGEVAFMDARGDSTALLPDPDAPGLTKEIDLVEDHVTLVVGADHRFENSLYVNLEYLYNSQGQSDNLNEAYLRRHMGETLSLGKHLGGLQLSYEFHPLLEGQAVWIYSFSDRSALLSPTITYSVANESELVAGCILGFGKRPSTRRVTLGTLPVLEISEVESEFGTDPNVFFMEYKLYF